MKDIDFLYDDTHLEKQELEKIAKIATKEPEKRDFNAVILRKFTLALINAIAEEKKIVREVKVIPKEIKKVIPEKPKEIKKEEPKIIPVKPIEPPKPEFPEHDIIKNTENKVLASAKLQNHNYFLSEPVLNDKDKELIKKIDSKIDQKLLKKPELVNDKNFMVKIVQKYSKRLKIPFNMDYFDKIRYYIVRDSLSYGKLDPLMQDVSVKEIHFNGIHKPITISFNNEENIETNVIFEDMHEVNNIIKKFFEKAKQKLTRDNNYLDIDISNIKVKAFYDFDLKESKLDIKK
ncbi:MAG: hypothetical protein KJ623_04270 [Nanoarchaeota archaeon]|nr:hypothetical protein [Nanoarchaeota archaeon]MBU0962479.1 hypothetical protein [Nanoarchaeota archaeon]